MTAEQDPTRLILETVGLEAYRQRRITSYQLRTILGIGSRYECDGFLKEHGVEKYTIADFDDDMASMSLTESLPAVTPPA